MHKEWSKPRATGSNRQCMLCVCAGAARCQRRTRPRRRGRFQGQAPLHCCHQQAALSRRLAMGDAAVGARGGGSGAGDGAEAQQAAEALQAGFDGGAPAPGWRARSKPRWTACWRARTRSTPASTRTRTATCPRTACGAWHEMCSASMTDRDVPGAGALAQRDGRNSLFSTGPLRLSNRFSVTVLNFKSKYIDSLRWKKNKFPGSNFFTTEFMNRYCLPE